MIYRYTLTLCPAKKFSDLDYLTHKKIFFEAAGYITNGLAFSREGKTLTINEVRTDRITVTLTSKSSLQNPARSLSALTRYLTSNYAELFKKYVYNKTLFKMELQSSSVEGQEDDEPVITNEILLKTMIDLLYSYTAKSESETQQRNKTIVQIKELVKPYVKKDSL